MRRGLAFVIAAAAMLLSLAPVAQADHHFVKITEVFPGTIAQPGAEFVELQMYSTGQNNFAPGASLTFYNGAGGTASNMDLLDVASGADQRTMLAGTATMESMFTVAADREYVGDNMSNSGGGVCLVSDLFPSPIDCVAWGTATVSGAGTSEPAIPDGSSLGRSIAAGCNTLLEPGDDTGSSLDDFAPAFPTPQMNSEAGPNSTCPNTTITKKPRTRTTDRTPKFEFTGGPDFECNLDNQGFSDCGPSYAPGRLSRGRHNLKVRATETDGSRDGTPASHSWKIVKRR
jgi:hypothetical protein